MSSNGKDKSKVSDGTDNSDEMSFSDFILSMGATALVAMGEKLPGTTHVSEHVKVDINHAKGIIATISMLSEKTSGNLTGIEDKMLKNLLYTLRVKFVEVSGKMQ